MVLRTWESQYFLLLAVLIWSCGSGVSGRHPAESHVLTEVHSASLAGEAEETDETAAAATKIELAVLTSLSGKVEVHRGAFESAPARPLTILTAGDRLEIGPQGRAVAVCRNDRLLSLSRSAVLQEELCHQATRLPEGSYAVVRPQGGRIQRFPGGFVPSTREDPNDYGLYPVVLAPRRTSVLEKRPVLSWTEVPGAREYQVEWSARSSRWTLERRREDIGCRYDERFPLDVKTCSFPWPETEPALEPGQTYFLKVAVRREDELRPQASRELNQIRTLSSEEIRRLRSFIEQLRANPHADGATLSLLEAGHHSRHGAFSEAIAAYSRSVELQPTAKVYNYLGDAYRTIELYRFAVESYNRALELAAEDDERAAAQLGLGLADYAWGRYSEAWEKAQVAHEVYQRLGLAEEAREALRLMEESRRRGHEDEET